MPERDDWIPRYAELRQALDIPICAPERNDGAHFARARWIAGNAVDICRDDPYWGGGGFTGTMRSAALCEAHGMAMELHHNAIAPYNVQVLGATSAALVPQFEEYEYDPEFGMPCVSSTSGFMPMDYTKTTTPPFLTSPLPAVNRNRDVVMPQVPGMGLTLNWDFINQASG